ncbi:hypothetical protein [Mycobacteroides abscessus]|uniref:hypothetical protein n=1 Tax=Mycobacteroides abscessus TaxID=36809 RepID=UPI0010404665|nr:hypothetical protein [Mycobacteroides abscessus]
MDSADFASLGEDHANREGLEEEALARLDAFGYMADRVVSDADGLIDATVSKLKASKPFDLVIIDLSVRLVLENFLLFEKLINLIREFAPKAIIAFNDSPDGSIDSVRRWAPPDAKLFNKIRDVGFPDRF